VFGVVTEICVARAVEILHETVGIGEIVIVSDAIRELDEAARDATVATWGQMDGVRLVTTDDAVEELAAARR